MATVTVSGRAEVEVEPTGFVLRGQLTATGASADAALAALVTTQREVLSQVPAVTFDQVRTYEQAQAEQGADRHRCTAALRLQVLDGVGRAGSVVASLTGAGADVSWIDWRVPDDAEAHREVQVAAVRDAVRRAGVYASGIDRRLGPLVSVTDGSTGSPAPVAHASARGRVGGELELTPSAVVIRASARVTFELDTA